MNGKVAIVTASATGIGKAISQQLASKGCSVVISSNNIDEVNLTLQEFQSKGYSVLGVLCDVGIQEHRKNLINKTKDKFGAIHYLVNNAAISSMGSFIKKDIKTVKKLWEINYHSIFELIQETLPQLRKQKDSCIVNIASQTAYELLPLIGHYAIAKLALVALTKVLAKQLVNDGIRVNAIAPGLIKTNFSKPLWEKNQQATISQIGVKKLGIVSDVSKVVTFLLSEDAGYITGECIAIAGKPISRL